MVTSKLKELESTRAKLAALEESVATELKRELASLPSRYGFPDTKSFIAAVQAAAGKRRGRKPGATKSAGAGRGRKKRATITDETRAQVKKLAGDGKTGGEIAKALRISLPSVQNIKKALGLVMARKKAKA
jgi:hypothetical protein